MTMMTPQPLDQQGDEEMLVPHSDLVEGPQPMEVAPADSARTVENQTTDETQPSRYVWTIENFSQLNTKKHYSEVFSVGSYKWRVLIFPKGNNVDFLSMYLDVADSSTLPYGWNRYAQFSLAVVNHIQNKFTVKKDTHHQFNQRESDWGFTSFMPLCDLYDPNKGYLVNDTCIIEADVAIRKVIDYWAYDSKKETGFVGLKNQGATCYMNSLLQTLYHIPYFRKAVYHMPTTENDNPTGSIPLALQSLFYKLQYNDTSVATKELTKSFGWDTYDSFMQHDVQELNRVLCEKLEDKMKGTVVEGTIQKLFEGHHMNYIECINVDFKSTRKESFYDLQLDVKGCKDVYASFDQYVEVERLEGDNKYHAEEHGLQDAKKGVLFIDFPPVLQLQLKRFEYDFMRDTMVKINDRYEFPLELDLDRDNGKYLSPDADRSVRNLYMLHSVLVHSGGVHGGHYYAFIRPTLSDQWFKFDDERVTKEDVKRALEEQYGGEEELPQTNPGYNNTPFKFTKYSNAYMLVYIRVSDKDKIICNVDEKDIAEHLRIRLKKEQEEKEDKRRYKAQAHLYTIIKVARDEDLKEQVGKDIYFDLVDHDKVRNFRIQKQMPFNLFKEEVAKELGIPVQCQRFWIWAKRQNHTYRPNRPLTPQEEAQTVGALREVSNKANNAELKLFLEVDHGQGLQPVLPPEKNKDDILLFFKLYDPIKEELRFVGRFFVKSSSKPIEILTKLNELAEFTHDQEIELFEEIKFEPSVMCERLDKRASFKFSQIEDGDIICFQKRLPSESEDQIRFPDVPAFLEYMKNRQIVHFRALEKPKEDEFCLELAKTHTYDDVVERVAQHLGLDDASKIRLTPHNCYSQQPKPNPIKYRSVDHLLDMLVHYNQISDILYYEVLDIPLPELQCLKTLKVAFHYTTKDEAIILNIRLPKPSTVGDVLNEIKTKVELSHPNAELRLLEVFYHKIYKIFPLQEKIENINDQYWTLRAEEIPEEEKNLGPTDRLIHVYHFTKESAQNQVCILSLAEGGHSTIEWEALSSYWDMDYSYDISFKSLAYFMVAPTLCYQPSYPRTSCIRKGWVVRQIIKLIIFTGFMGFIVEQYINPIVQNSQHPLKGDLLYAVERVLKLSVPNLYVWLCMFYCFFHLWLNILAELLCFGDREFYKDWWNAKTVEEYWRMWNMPVHKWMVRHMYFPCMRNGIPKVVSFLVAFFVSGIFHELCIAVPCHIFKLWAFMGIMLQVPLVVLTNYLQNKFQNSMVGNMVFWCVFCIFGQPMCLLLYYHDLMNRKAGAR